MLESLQALVLQTKPYGESHRLVILLTRERGIIRAIANRAVLQHNHLYAATQELGRSLLQVRLAGDALATVTQGTLLDNYTELRVDMEKYVYSSAVMELLLNMDRSGGRVSSVDLFDDVIAGLERMRQSVSPRFVLAYLQLSLLPSFGVTLSIASCAHCGAKLERSTGFSFQSGGFVCADCALRIVELRPISLAQGVWRVMKQMTEQRLGNSGRDQFEQFLFRDQIDLIEYEECRRLRGRNLIQHKLVAGWRTVRSVRDTDNQVDVADGMLRDIHHILAKPVPWFMQTGRIQKDSLPLVARQDASNAGARSLRFVRHDGDLLSHQTIDERRFARIGSTDERHKSRLFLTLHARPYPLQRMRKGAVRRVWRAALPS